MKNFSKKKIFCVFLSVILAMILSGCLLRTPADIDLDEWDESDVAWDASRREVTHYVDEEEFLKNKKDDIKNWTKITGDSCSLVGKEWFRQKKDDHHSVAYYTDTVYSDVQDIMGGREKNFEVSTRQLGDQLNIVCCIYSQAGGFLQHFTKDIERSLLLQYDPDKDSVYLKETYEGKEVAYWDGNWVIYRKERELFLENLETHNVDKVFARRDFHVRRQADHAAAMDRLS